MQASPSKDAELREHLVLEQLRIAESVRTEPLSGVPEHAVGVDAAYIGADGDLGASGKGVGIGAAVVVDIGSLAVVEQATVSLDVEVGYQPGLLAFREAPLVLAAIDRLAHTPELVICDGHGVAHPQRAGLACHVGVELRVPTIGCAKQLLVGEHKELGADRGSFEWIIDQGQTVGAIVRTQDGVNPVYVSVGHLIDLDSSVQVVLDLASQFRLPETTRASDQLARREMKQRSEPGTRGTCP